MSDNDAVRARALELQAAGPDEFPFGYYVHLAEREAQAVQRLEVSYELEGNELDISTTYRGVNLVIAMNYGDDEAGEHLDILIASVPRIVEAVLESINAQEATP